MRHWLITAVALLCSFTASAQDIVQIDGTWYLLSAGIQETEVTSNPDGSTKYSGSIVIPPTIVYEEVEYNVVGIGVGAFSGCTDLTSITIPECVVYIGGEAFSGCSSLTSITIPECVVYIRDFAFSGCSSLTSITIPQNVTNIMDGTFQFCSNLTSISIPEGVTSVGYNAFKECRSLTSIILPESVTSIGNSAFYGCHSLTSVTLPTSMTGSIEDYTFFDCIGLTSISIPEGVTSIGYNAFAECMNLTSVVIPTSVSSIGEGAFYNCNSLTSIAIPANVTSIGNDALLGCSSLTSITCEAVTPPTVGDSYTFYDIDKSIPLYVPAASVSAYQTADYWKEFTNIQAIAPAAEVVTINQYGSATFCSDKVLDFSEVEGLKAYAATGYNTTTGVVTLTRVMTAKAGMGLFVKGEPGEYNVPMIESTADNTLNMLVGTLESTAVNGTSGDGLYANFKYTIREGDATPMFYQFADSSTLSAGKAYLQIPVAWLLADAKSISLRFDDGETTDIEEMENQDQSSGVIYDLMGRRVTTPQCGSLYLIDGKKIIY